jgi:hypothetical protein
MMESIGDADFFNWVSEFINQPPTLPPECGNALITPLSVAGSACVCPLK